MAAPNPYGGNPGSPYGAGAPPPANPYGAAAAPPPMNPYGAAAPPAGPPGAPYGAPAPVASGPRFLRFTPSKVAAANGMMQMNAFEFYAGPNLVRVASVRADGSDSPAAEGPEKLIDAQPGTKFLAKRFVPVTFDLGQNVPVTGYRYVTGNDNPDRDPQRWVLEGSMDGLNFFVMDDRRGADQPTVAARNTPTGVFPFTQVAPPPAGPRFVRFTPFKVAAANGMMQMNAFELYAGPSLVRVASVRADGSDSPAAEGPEKLIDAQTGTKFLAKRLVPVTFDLGQNVPVTGYRYVTGNDNPDRDPRRWLVEGSMDGLNFFVMDDRRINDEPTIPARNAPAQMYNFTATAPRPPPRFFRLTPTKVAAANGMMQMNAFEFYAGPNLVRVASVRADGSESPAAEGPEKLIDAQPGTKFLAKKFVPITFDLGQNVPVTGYRYVTGNDCPERDLQSWVLEASADGINFYIADDRRGSVQPAVAARKTPSQLFPIA